MATSLKIQQNVVAVNTGRPYHSSLLLNRDIREIFFYLFLISLHFSTMG